MRYLTREYVNWLGLQLIPVATRRRGVRISPLDNALPKAGESSWATGVIRGDWLYLQEPWGSFVREAPVARQVGLHA